MQIRKGTGADISRCVEMAAEFHKIAYGLLGIEFCPISTAASFELCIEHGLLSVAQIDGLVVGMVAGVKAPLMMNHNHLVGAELAWWVEPDYRKTSAGLKLLKFAENLAIEAGVKMWSMMLLESSEPEKVAKIYDKMGYKPTERTYLKVF